MFLASISWLRGSNQCHFVVPSGATFHFLVSSSATFHFVCLPVPHSTFLCLPVPHSTLLCLQVPHSTLLCLPVPHSTLLCLQVPHSTLLCLQVPHSTLLCLQVPHSKLWWCDHEFHHRMASTSSLRTLYMMATTTTGTVLEFPGCGGKTFIKPSTDANCLTPGTRWSLTMIVLWTWQSTTLTLLRTSEYWLHNVLPQLEGCCFSLHPSLTLGECFNMAHVLCFTAVRSHWVSAISHHWHWVNVSIWHMFHVLPQLEGHWVSAFSSSVTGTGWMFQLGTCSVQLAWPHKSLWF